MNSVHQTPRATWPWLLALAALAPVSMGARGCGDPAPTPDAGTVSAAGPGSAGAPGGGAMDGGGGVGLGGGGDAGSADGCVVGGKTYAVGKAVPSIDGCNACSCAVGGVVCTEKACIGPVCGGLAGLTCAKDEYCKYDAGTLCGAADATGMCSKMPEACTDQVSPVCGCDSKTYSSACEAGLAGVSVAAQGECGDGGGGGGIGAVQHACGGLGGAHCLSPQFCNYPLEAICGAADGTGICSAKPGICTDDYTPVCGCDGMTYGNACGAAAAGTSVASLGECK